MISDTFSDQFTRKLILIIQKSQINYIKVLFKTEYNTRLEQFWNCF